MCGCCAHACIARGHARNEVSGRSLQNSNLLHCNQKSVLPNACLNIPPAVAAGVFSNVISPSTKAKLRLLFEVAPLALLVEKAGGESSCDGKLVSGLDVEVTEIDQRTQICYGSKNEVARFEKYLYGSSPRFADVAAAL